MIKFYTKDNINKKINYPDIYFTPQYGECCEYSDNAFWELCEYKDLIYTYLKKPIQVEDKTFYDLITPYGYSGYYFKNNDTYYEFISLFRREAFTRNYITEVVRQNPYLGINLEKYDLINSKKLLAIKVDNYNYFLKTVLNPSKRNKLKKAIKLKLKYSILKIDKVSLEKKFIPMYNKTMTYINAKKYFYFNKCYYNKLTNLNKTYLAQVSNDNNIIIGLSIIFEYNNFIHYHLSCNDRSSNCITDFLLINTLKTIGINKTFILGCGLTDMDNLYNFKKKLSNQQYDYNIYKNIINPEIYNKLSQDISSEFFPSYRN